MDEKLRSFIYGTPMTQVSPSSVSVLDPRALKMDNWRTGDPNFERVGGAKTPRRTAGGHSPEKWLINGSFLLKKKDKRGLTSLDQMKPGYTPHHIHGALG